MQSVFCPWSEIWGIFAWFQTFAQQKGVVAPLKWLLALRLLQQNARLSELMPFLPLRFLLLDVTLGHGHSRYMMLSISISAAPTKTQQKEERLPDPLFVWTWLPLHQRKVHMCSFHTIIFFARVCVCCSLLLHCHLSICYLPKPEAPASFWVFERHW